MTHPWKDPKEPEAPDYKTAGLGEEFLKLVRHRAKIAEVEGKVKAEKEANARALEAALVKAKADKVRCEQFAITRVPGKAGASKIDGKRLLEAGVSAVTIQACTVTGKPGKGYVLVTDTSKPRGKQDEAAPLEEAA